MNNDNPIKVFISYSHDSPEHKRWVTNFATKLRSKGIDASADFWDFGLGDDLGLFMERSVVETNRVIIICTPEYVRKADAGLGGVGYEKMIITAEILGKNSVAANKFIPAIRMGNGDGAQLMPNFLGVRKYVDFRKDEDFEEKIEELISDLKKHILVNKPPLGETAFVQQNPAKITTISAVDDKDVIKIYNTALNLVRAEDMLGWRKYIQNLKKSFKPQILDWRRKYDHKPPSNSKELIDAVTDAMNIILPITSVAMAGIESGKNDFNDQRSLFDEFYQIAEWSGSGRVVLAELPSTLGFIYQALHGAVSIHTNQPELAVRLANMQVGFGYDNQKEPLWKNHDLVGWPKSLDGNCVTAWNYISTIFNHTELLEEIFGTSEEYIISLSGYYIILNFMEFAETLKRYPDLSKITTAMILNIPLEFMRVQPSLLSKSSSRVARNPKIFEDIIQEHGLTKNQAATNWKYWQDICRDWLNNSGGWRRDHNRVNLMEDLNWK